MWDGGRGRFIGAHGDTAGLVKHAVIPHGLVPRRGNIPGDGEAVIFSGTDREDFEPAVAGASGGADEAAAAQHGVLGKQEDLAKAAGFYGSANGSTAKLVSDGERLSIGQDLNVGFESIVAAEPNGVEIIPRRGQPRQ